MRTLLLAWEGSAGYGLYGSVYQRRPPQNQLAQITAWLTRRNCKNNVIVDPIPKSANKSAAKPFRQSRLFPKNTKRW